MSIALSRQWNNGSNVGLSAGTSAAANTKNLYKRGSTSERVVGEKATKHIASKHHDEENNKVSQQRIPTAQNVTLVKRGKCAPALCCRAPSLPVSSVGTTVHDSTRRVLGFVLSFGFVSTSEHQICGYGTRNRANAFSNVKRSYTPERIRCWEQVSDATADALVQPLTICPSASPGENAPSAGLPGA
jgi:hypothetical protein